MNFFPYGERELMYLRKRDHRLNALMEVVGPLQRPVDSDLFASLISSVVSQQISTKAALTVSTRLSDRFDGPTPASLARATVADIQAVGLSFRKAQYIQTIAQRVAGGTFDLMELSSLPDELVIERLMTLPGIGRWTAEMLLLFALLRPNVFSVDDFGIRKGVMKLYHHQVLTKARMERYRKRYAPYGSVASLYLWELASHPERLDEIDLRLKKGKNK